MKSELRTSLPSNSPAQRTAPGLELSDDRVLHVTANEEDQLRTLFGTKTDTAAEAILQSAIQSLGTRGLGYMDFVPAMAVEMEPRDAAEAMLISQMATTHIAMTSLAQKMADAQTSELHECFERSMTRLSRTYLAQMEGLKKYRAKAQQVVRVEHVTVHEGGQAIVGAVTHEGGGRDEK